MTESAVRVTTTLPAGMTRRMRTIIREAAIAGADWHWRHHMPKHFQHGNASRYGYRRRSKRWQQRKQRLGRGTTPLVFTGNTMRSVLGGRRIAATGTRGARLIMQAALPGFTGRFRMKAGQRFLTSEQERQLARVTELQAMTQDELDAIGRVETRAVQTQLDGAFTRVLKLL